MRCDELNRTKLRMKSLEEEIVQYKGHAYQLKRLWYWPFGKYWVPIGVAKGDEPQMFPVPKTRNTESMKTEL